MRPVRLVIEGFSAFRDKVEVDFEGADLFALVGSTGSGKSSLIDAMVFALYGSVPRLDKRLVHPVITQGRVQARVRFDFAVGETAYSAVRVVKRTAKGATTPEARLESGDQVLAGSARELDVEIERLLGLSFAQFTTCVVLPQGEFARLLHDTAAERQDLLVRLLDLGLYRQLGSAARSRASAADEGAQQIAAQLAELGDIAIDELEARRARVAVLEDLCEQLGRAEPRLAALAAQLADAAADAERATDRLRRLDSVAVPAGVAELAGDLVDAVAALDVAAADEMAAGAAVDAARAGAASLTPRHELERSRDLHERRIGLVRMLDKGAAAVEVAGVACAAAAAAMSAATEAHDQATAALEVARSHHRAAHLRSALVAGEPCPVCDQVVVTTPTTRDAGVDAAEVAATDAARAAAAARTALEAAGAEEARVVAKLEAVRADLDAVERALEGGPTPEAIDAGIAACDAADAAVVAAEAAHRAARAARTAAERRRADLVARESDAWSAFDATRDAVAVLEPPPAERSDLVAAWDLLTSWAAGARPAEDAARDAADARRREAEEGRRTVEAELAAACVAAGLVVPPGSSARTVADAARTEAIVEVARFEARIDEVERLVARRAALEEQRVVAALLGRLLRADGFEKWLLDEASSRLLEGATTTLLQLSGGQYSLTLDEKREQFVVVDHHAADERRLARTLSGGETFLASLALALALAEQVAELSAEGAPKLESMFLDEGFGTLDADTLDVVATAIEELGASGRVVGLVSHVRELAERVPVRFEVVKGPTTSTVTRVDR